MTSAEGEPASGSTPSDARGVCPDCGGVVEPFQEYCLVCGARLGETGSASLAERWRNALPLTDKEWGWPVLIALAIAILASVFAILAGQSNKTTTLKALGQAKSQANVIAEVSERYRDVTMQVLRVTFLSALVLELVATVSTAVVAVEVGLRLRLARGVFDLGQVGAHAARNRPYQSAVTI